MKPIFNSLGSNYSQEFVRQTNRLLLKPWNWYQNPDSQKITNKYQQKFHGSFTCFYKGRGALTQALIDYGIGAGDQVLTQGFTCYAVESAIASSGAAPVFVDTAKNSLNLSLENLKNTYKNTSQPKAVILQHTLGYPVDPKPIADWCRAQNLILIEDLAHAYGATDSEGKQLGDYSGSFILSFGRDKIIDTITGGAHINKPAAAKPTLTGHQDTYPGRLQIFKDLLYPQLTWSIRSSYNLTTGKAIHYLAKKTHLLTPALQAGTPMAALPSIWLDFVDQAIESVPVNIGVRRGNALIYHRTLSNPSTLIDEKLINTGACLRYPLLVSNRNQVIRALKKHHVHISDTWYKAVVDCGSGPNISTYRSGCPNAQYLAEHIINLPTHQYVTPEIAKTIAVLINQLTN